MMFLAVHLVWAFPVLVALAIGVSCWACGFCRHLRRIDGLTDAVADMAVAALASAIAGPLFVYMLYRSADGIIRWHDRAS